MEVGKIVNRPDTVEIHYKAMKEAIAKGDMRLAKVHKQAMQRELKNLYGI